MADLLNPVFLDPELAREHLEALRWAAGRVCPHCGTVDESGAVASKNHKPGLYYCNACAKSFTVTVGTLFERSHIPLNKWLMAFHLMAASKKGMSAKQLERMLGVSYKSAWFMAHRIREAMTTKPTNMMGGSGTPVEVDETYWGNRKDESIKPRSPKNSAANKIAIVSLVDRKSGEKRTYHMGNVTGAGLREVLKAQVSPSAHLMTDQSKLYTKLGMEFAQHSTVNHSIKEYARGEVTTNTAESSFALLKRGLVGTFHSVSEKHLQRYANEFDFRWNTRQSQGFTDLDRAAVALKGIEGKRLTYRRTAGDETTIQAV
jgi:transposase-like protein